MPYFKPDCAAFQHPQWKTRTAGRWRSDRFCWVKTLTTFNSSQHSTCCVIAHQWYQCTSAEYTVFTNMVGVFDLQYLAVGRSFLGLENVLWPSFIHNCVSICILQVFFFFFPTFSALQFSLILQSYFALIPRYLCCKSSPNLFSFTEYNPSLKY